VPDNKEREDPTRLREVSGMLKSIDLDKGTLEVMAGEGRDVPPQAKTFSLAGKDVVVTGNLKRPLKLADLRQGTRLMLRLSANDDVVQIQAEGPSGVLVIRSVDVGKRTITFPAADRGAQEKVMPVARDAQIEIEGRPAKLSDLKAEQRATVIMSLDLSEIVAVAVGGPGRRGPDGQVNGARVSVQGVVKSIDADKRTVVVEVQEEREPRERTFTIAADARLAIAIGRETDDLKQLEKGMQIALALSEDGRSVIALRARRAEAPSVVGHIKRIDRDGTTLVLTVREGPERKFELLKGVRVAVPGKEDASIRDLKAGMCVAVMLSADRQSVAAVRVLPNEAEAQGPQVMGTLKAVDAAKNTLTLTIVRDGVPAEQPFQVDEKATVVVDRNPRARLSDLREGMRVGLFLDRDRRNVVGIQVVPAEGRKER
jgi:hypothetical protein